MEQQRMSLVNHDVVREVCDSCGGEMFVLVPMGGTPAEQRCSRCGSEAREVDFSETSIGRLVTRGPDGMPVAVRKRA